MNIIGIKKILIGVVAVTIVIPTAIVAVKVMNGKEDNVAPTPSNSANNVAVTERNTEYNDQQPLVTAKADALVYYNDGGQAAQAMLNSYNERNKELINNIYNWIEGYSDNYKQLYIELPETPSLADNLLSSAQDAVYGKIQGYIIDAADSVLGVPLLSVANDIYGGFDTLNKLLNIDTTPTILMSYVAADMLKFTTVLNSVCQNGTLNDDELFVAVDCYGNFMQRLSTIDQVYSSSWTYEAEHQVVINWYKEYMANKGVIELLEKLLQENYTQEFSSEDAFFEIKESIVADISAVLDKADPYISLGPEDIFDDPWGDNPSKPESFNVLSFNYDKPKITEMEKMASLRPQIIGLVFDGLLADLLTTGVVDNAEKAKATAYSSIVKVNSLAARELNANVTALNELKTSIDVKAAFLKELIQNSENESYYAIYATLAQMPDSELKEFISFDKLILDFTEIGIETYGKLNAIKSLYNIALVESPEKPYYLAAFDEMKEQLAVYLNNNWNSENYDDITERINKLKIECIELQREIIGYLADGVAGPHKVYSRYHDFVTSGENRAVRVYNVSRTSGGNGSFLFIEEHQYDGRDFVPLYVSFYDLDGNIYYIEDMALNMCAYFDENGDIIRASENAEWMLRVDNIKEVSEWMYDNLYSVSNIEYFNQLKRRSLF